MTRGSDDARPQPGRRMAGPADGTLPPVLARAAAHRVGRCQEHAVSRRQLYAAGVPRWLVRREIRVRRWQRAGRQTVVLHNGPLSVGTRRWVAVLEGGPRAALAGVTALQEAGIQALDDQTIHVIVARGSRRVRVKGVRFHESRRWSESDVVRDGLPRVRPPVAAVHGALWARTDREATLLLTLAVQQRRASPAELHDATAGIRRHRRRRLLASVIAELAGGVRSLNELDVARAMRSRGLPEPSRQRVRQRPSGSQYLDADFPDHDITLEIDGPQHEEPEARLDDLVRDVGLATDGRTVVRIPMVAWRLGEARVLDALEGLFAARGWRRPAA
jgi:very-short-patch-repair endonuclease